MVSWLYFILYGQTVVVIVEEVEVVLILLLPLLLLPLLLPPLLLPLR